MPQANEINSKPLSISYLININIIKISFLSFLSSSLRSSMILITVGIIIVVVVVVVVVVGSVGLAGRSGLASVTGSRGIGDNLLAHTLVHHVEIIVLILWNNEKLFLNVY